MSNPKPTHGWAIVMADGGIIGNFGELMPIYTTREAAEADIGWDGEIVIPVLITPLTSEAQEKK